MRRGSSGFEILSTLVNPFFESCCVLQIMSFQAIPAWLRMAGQATTGWFRQNCFSNPNHAVLEFTKNSKKGSTRVVIRMHNKGPVRYLDIVDNGPGQCYDEVLFTFSDIHTLGKLSIEKP